MNRFTSRGLAAVMALAVAGALFASFASADEHAPRFETTGEYPTTVSGSSAFENLKQQVITLGNALRWGISCEEVKFGNDTLIAPRSALILPATYSGCKAQADPKQKGLTTTINMKSCVYIFNVAVGAPYKGGWDVWCESPGDAIRVTMFASGGSGEPVCTWDIGPGQWHSGDPYTDLFYGTDKREGRYDGQRVTMNVSGIEYSRVQGKEVSCGLPTNTDGTYTGQSRLSVLGGNFVITGSG